MELIIKWLEFFDKSIAYVDKELPFWDISSNSSKKYFLLKALDLGLVSSSTKFYPQNPITKAELFSMLSNIPLIKKELNNIQNYYD